MNFRAILAPLFLVPAVWLSYVLHRLDWTGMFYVLGLLMAGCFMVGCLSAWLPEALGSILLGFMATTAALALTVNLTFALMRAWFPLSIAVMIAGVPATICFSVYVHAVGEDFRNLFRSPPAPTTQDPADRPCTTRPSKIVDVDVELVKNAGNTSGRYKN